ncbi:hypothetical protein P4S95_07590 [Aneurinibacillus aneurinilyticus]|uniref:Uncharacterized protein n=1 Tax=Aneurinibacillus aneurinilyticus TaxID=1391 RepID=A0A848CZZ7_ANEAE|nr:hypothetical protein [Aneurinibacillus aneurinilyticus]MCI1695075.1 hypothetical protein [Aneurinibacillus aneurinilyticus]MED0670085.1 hypothetical protein [Aneurinibacillus aneurinilyticus]NME99387.1 hypothetical protein [Aneurinibacillus aneurinilyticus]
MYILQETLFSFEEWLKLESKERFEFFFSSFISTLSRTLTDMVEKQIAEQLF